jgi:hypothetical protein
MFATLRLILPALLPSWRFFASVGPSPRIDYALLVNASDEPTGWTPFRPRPARRSVAETVWRLIWNPRDNETLYLISCAERILESERARAMEEIAIRIDRALAGEQVEAPWLVYRLSLVSRGPDGALQSEVAFISARHMRRCR